MLILLLALLQSDESIREKTLRLAQDPGANRAEILKLGPAAIRPLLEAGVPDLDDVLLELRYGAEGREPRAKLAQRLTMRVKGMKADHLVRFLSSTAGTPILVDPGIRASVESKLATIDLINAPLEEGVNAAAAQAGLVIGYRRGAIVLSSPDRLWAWPPEKPRVLDESAVARLKEHVARLAADGLDVRDQAARAILDTGESAIPHLEEASKAAEGDHKTRIRELVLRLRARSAPPALVEGLAIESQSLTDAGKTVLKALCEKKASLDVENLPLGAGIKLLLAQIDVNGDADPSADKVKLSCDLKDLRAIDALYWATVPLGFDVCFKDGKVWVDTRAAVAKLLKGQ